MNRKNIIKWVVLLSVILSMSIYVYTIKEMSVRGYSTSENMILRGLFCLSVGVIASKIKGYELIPQNKKTQIFRFFASGFASYFFTASFAYLKASTIALIIRLDIPFLLVLVTLFTNQSKNKKSSLQFWLSIWSILIISFITFSGNFSDENPLGYVYAFTSVILIALGYLFMKNSAGKENIFVLSNIFSLSNLLFGLTLLFLNDENIHFELNDIWVFILYTLSQFGIYILSIQLYKWYDVERARLPYVFATFIIFFMEIILGKRAFDIEQFILSIIITGMIITIILNPKTIETKHNFLDKT
jgi:drug/metabolite transporter (DMT)-like permease